jgi:hypothetical protein
MSLTPLWAGLPSAAAGAEGFSTRIRVLENLYRPRLGLRNAESIPDVILHRLG